MAIDFHDSAFRHGISRDRMLHVITHCRLPHDDPDRVDVVLYLGDDWNGVELEVGAVECENGDLMDNPCHGADGQVPGHV
jgi:hypothetical protein